MKVSSANYSTMCGCRSVGECSHNSFAEFRALDHLVDQMADAMKKKLRRAAMDKGKFGWDHPKWSPDEIKAELIRHVEKGDPIDVANFAAFWWNRL